MYLVLIGLNYDHYVATSEQRTVSINCAQTAPYGWFACLSVPPVDDWATRNSGYTWSEYNLQKGVARIH